MSASAAAKQLGIHVRTAQIWAQMYKTDPDSIFIKHKKTGRSRILHEEHKQVILEYIDENPSAALEQVMERLLQKFRDLKVSKSTVYNFTRHRNEGKSSVIPSHLFGLRRPASFLEKLLLFPSDNEADNANSSVSEDNGDVYGFIKTQSGWYNKYTKEIHENHPLHDI
ncbi:hypothetical protein G6F70_009209 [Rhizopus microsporus]|nr:hypothetical protein G6F70_009209 [Rhizopus microsporus]